MSQNYNESHSILDVLNEEYDPELHSDLVAIVEILERYLKGERGEKDLYLPVPYNLVEVDGLIGLMYDGRCISAHRSVKQVYNEVRVVLLVYNLFMGRTGSERITV